MSFETQDTRRKPYAAPQLLVYGDIREITRTTTGGKNDDGGGKGAKTGG